MYTKLECGMTVSTSGAPECDVNVLGVHIFLTEIMTSRDTALHTVKGCTVDKGKGKGKGKAVPALN
jgi:hypothetical protein